MPVFLNDQLPWSHLYSKTPPSSGRQPDPATSCCMERLAAYAAQRQEGWARRRQTLSRWSTFFRVEVRRKVSRFALFVAHNLAAWFFVFLHHARRKLYTARHRTGLCIDDAFSQKERIRFYGNGMACLQLLLDGASLHCIIASGQVAEFHLTRKTSPAVLRQSS